MGNLPSTVGPFGEAVRTLSLGQSASRITMTQKLAATETTNLSKAQIGASGVHLVQYKLLKRGVEAAPMPTDDGIDLVAYAPKLGKALTIQVKTCLRPKPTGGYGRLSLSWFLPRKSPAELIALANLEKDQVWLLTLDQFKKMAQQQPPKNFQLYFYVDPDFAPKESGPLRHERDFKSFIIDGCLAEIFGLPH